MTDLPFSDEPEPRPRQVTRTSVDELLRRVSPEFAPDEITLSTRYPNPRGQRTTNNSTVSANAQTLDGVLTHPNITGVVRAGTNVVLTNLILDATNASRKMRVEMTPKGITSHIEGIDNDWVQGRCNDVHQALEGDYPSWALWRPTRRRGFLGLGLALDAVAATTAWVTTGERLLSSPLTLILALTLLILIPALCSLVGNRFTRHCHIRIGASDPTWFWQRWSVSDKIALVSVVISTLVLTTQLLTATTSTEGSHQPTRAPNPTATSSELP
ncbi:hypothetical protein [Streptomyces chartreusis]